MRTTYRSYSSLLVLCPLEPYRAYLFQLNRNNPRPIFRHSAPLVHSRFTYVSVNRIVVDVVRSFCFLVVTGIISLGLLTEPRARVWRTNVSKWRFAKTDYLSDKPKKLFATTVRVADWIKIVNRLYTAPARIRKIVFNRIIWRYHRDNIEQRARFFRIVFWFITFGSAGDEAADGTQCYYSTRVSCRPTRHVCRYIRSA